MPTIPPLLLTPLQKSLTGALSTEKSNSGRALHIRGVVRQTLMGGAGGLLADLCTRTKDTMSRVPVLGQMCR